MKITAKQNIKSYGHLFKALFRNYHQELTPTLKKYITEDAIVFDVGGHSGQFAKLFSKLSPKGQVFTFEPASYARSMLYSMVGLKKLHNVSILPYGLGDAKGSFTLNIPIKKSGSIGFGLSFIGDTSHAKHSIYEEQVNISTVDDTVSLLGLPRVDFIKADIEGYEFSMLLGAKDTLSKYKPTLLLELNDQSLSRAQHSVKDVFTYLDGLGYNQAYKIDGKVLKEVDMKGETKGISGDFLFV